MRGGPRSASGSWFSALALSLYAGGFSFAYVSLKTNPDAVSAVVKATQRAEAACLANPAPCIDALVEASLNLQREKELANWNAGRELFFSRGSNGLPLGAFELARVRKDHDMVRTLYGLERPFDPKDAFSDEFLDAVVEPPR